jgi:hypothetical protein
MSAALALQKAIRARLASFAPVTALVPASNIFDRHARPESFPAIVMGEDQELGEDVTLTRHHLRVFATLHLWHREPGLTGVKAIAGAIRNAVRAGFPELDTPYRRVDLRYESARFLRDPDGITSHGVVTLEARIEDTP